MTRRLIPVACFRSPTDSDGNSGGEGHLSRKERESARHKDEVLAAAMGLLVSQSYHEVTVQQIADAAEFSVGYLYKLFANKDDIYAAVLARAESDLLATARRAMVEAGTFTDRLNKMLESIFEWISASPAFAGRNFRDLSMAGDKGFNYCEASEEKEQTLGELEILLQEGKDTGELGDYSLREMSMVFRALMGGVIEERRRHNIGERIEWSEYPPILFGVFLRAYGTEKQDA
ncbi:MAG: TetR/AcrR family transcriptional regulator [bacterium]|nr:TetR/AcrR family transcriptional regulator [bacterium]